MEDKRKDESLGVERLPQTELDFVPGVGEKPTSEPAPPDNSADQPQSPSPRPNAEAPPEK